MTDVATAVTTPVFPFADGERLLTAADLATLPLEMPSGPIDYELENGRLVIMSPPGRRHGSLQATLAAHFKMHGEWQGHGQAYTDIGVVLWRNPDRVVAPDVAFVVKERLPVRESPEGYLETVPDLVVEIRSKNDPPGKILKKAHDYLRAGTRVVWIVDAEGQTVTVYDGEKAPTVSSGSDPLSCAAILPGFEVTVATLFAQS